VLEALCWRDGVFRFTPDEGGAAAEAGSGASSVTRAVDPLLMEAAQRAATWSRLEPHVSHARVVPAFRDLEPGQLPPLRLSPVQWDVLAHVDGSRDLVALAEAMQRDLVEVAEEVHGLIVSGLLAVREAPVAPRRNPTPPVVGAVAEPTADTRDLWIPDPFMAAATGMPGGAHTDAIFDPIEVGVLTPDGLPRMATPRATPAVALSGSGPSFPGEARAPYDLDDAPSLVARATALASSGQLAEAVAWWQAALRHPMADAEEAQVREAIALASRLHVLLHGQRHPERDRW